MSTLGKDLVRQLFSRSHRAPSRYRPLMKQPEGAFSVTWSGLVNCVQGKMTNIYCVWEFQGHGNNIVPCRYSA